MEIRKRYTISSTNYNYARNPKKLEIKSNKVSMLSDAIFILMFL